MMFWVVLSSVMLSIPSCHSLLSAEHREIFGPAVDNVAPNSEMYRDIIEVTNRFGTDPDNWSTDAKDTIADIKSDLAETTVKRKLFTSLKSGVQEITRPGGSVGSPASLPALVKPNPSPKSTILETVETYFTSNQKHPKKSLLDKLIHHFKTQHAAPKSPTASTSKSFPIPPVTPHKAAITNPSNPAQTVPTVRQTVPTVRQTVPNYFFNPGNIISFDSLPSPISQIPAFRPARYTNYNLHHSSSNMMKPVYSPSNAVAFYNPPQSVPQTIGNVGTSNIASAVQPWIYNANSPTSNAYYNKGIDYSQQSQPATYYKPALESKVNSIPPLAFNWGRPPAQFHNQNPPQYWSSQVQPRSQKQPQAPSPLPAVPRISGPVFSNTNLKRLQMFVNSINIA